MSDGIYAATSGALAQLQQLDSVSNNLANANTVGFKKQGMLFREVMANAEISHTNIDAGVTQMEQGGFEKTDRDFDVALAGPGFFAVDTTHGTRYTRQGHFNLNAQGTLVNQDGAPVLDKAGKSIQLDPTLKYTIGRDGDISNDGQRVAQLAIVDLNQPEPEGATLFKTQYPPTESQTTSLQTGMLEQSNVNPVEQMTRLIELNRLYDATMSAIRTYSEIDSKTANEMTR